MTRAIRIVVALALMFTVAGATPAFAHRTDPPRWAPLSYRPAPADNPLKGFMPYASTYETSTPTFPHSVEWFSLPLRDVMTGPHSFTWAPLERQLNDIARRGHQAAFRFY